MGGNLPAIVYHSLNAGEVSPRFAREDQNKYMAACETMLNFVPLVLGGAYFRPGTQLVAKCKIVAGHPLKRLIAFVASRNAAYVLEVGQQYIRVYRDGLPLFASVTGLTLGANNEQFGAINLGSPVEELLGDVLAFPDTITSEDQFVLLGLFPINLIGEVVSPYADTDLADIFTVQSIDVQYWLHRSYPVHKLTRVSATEFTFTQVNFDPPATFEEEPTGADLGGGSLTPSAITGTGVTFTADNSVFLAADVGRILVSRGSRGLITAQGGNTLTVNIIDDFEDLSPIVAANWRLRGSPQTTLDITNDKKFKGEVVTLTAGGGAFRAADAGKWVTLFGGLVRIDAVGSTTSVTGTIKVELSDIKDSDPAATRAWTLEVAAWSDTLGYPSSGCFFQERLHLCKGLTINSSVTNDFENYGKGAEDDAAIARTLSDDDIDAIAWIKGDDVLKVGTGSGVYSCSATTQNGALTPKSFKVSPIDSHGGAHIPPLRVNPVMIYVDVSQRNLRELAYDFAQDKFKSPQLFRLAEHLIDGFFITEIFASANPDNIIYVRRNDGVLLGLVYEQAENVIGWFRIETAGDIKSACVIPRPSTGKDWLWQICERANGTFVEHYEPNHANTGREWDELKTDSAIVTTHDANFVVSGLENYEGQTVWVIGDGQLFNIRRNALNVIESTAVVEDGQITLDPQIVVSRVEIGLGYEGVIVPVKAMVPAEAGGPLIAKSYNKIGVRIQRTLGLEMRGFRVGMNEPGDDQLVGEMLEYRKPYHPMDAQIPLQQGTKCVATLGNDPFARIEIKQRLPFPAEVLNVIGRLHVGDEWDCETYNQTEQFARIVTPADLNVSAGYGAFDCGFPCPLGQFSSAVYDGGTAIAGPAIRIGSTSTQAAFYGLAALYFPSEHIIALVLYHGQALTALGTVITAVNKTLAVNDVLLLESSSTDAEKYQVRVNGTIVLGPQTIAAATLPTNRQCVGFAQITIANDFVFAGTDQVFAGDAEVVAH